MKKSNTGAEEVKEKIKKNIKPHRDKLSEVLGYTDIALNRNLVMESTMDNFLLDSLLDLTGAEMAFSNGWRYGAPILPSPITLNDLWNIIPVNPPGERIQKLFVQGEEVDFDRIYGVVFVTSQGFRVKYGSERKKLDIKAIENLQRYLKKIKKLNLN